MSDRKNSPTQLTLDDAALLAFFREVAGVHQQASAKMEAALPHGLLMPHVLVLRILADTQTPKSMTDLARAFGVSKATITNTVRRLSERALVEVHPHPHDKRGKEVSLTRAGAKVHEEAMAAMLPAARDVVEAAGPSRVEAALPHLRAIRKTLSAMRAGNGGRPSLARH